MLCIFFSGKFLFPQNLWEGTKQINWPFCKYFFFTFRNVNLMWVNFNVNNKNSFINKMGKKKKLKKSKNWQKCMYSFWGFICRFWNIKPHSENTNPNDPCFWGVPQFLLWKMLGLSSMIIEVTSWHKKG